MTACSQAAADEPLPGTASAARFVLAVEQSGPYRGRDAVTDSGLPPELAGMLSRQVARRGGKLLLIRRPGSHPETTHHTRRVFLSVARFPRTTTWTAVLGDPLEALRWLDVPPPAERLTRPVMLVCTHGRRDVCCARHGRALLSTETPFEVWESSHQGGHRFAPVVWELLTGYQHGRVSPRALSAIGVAAAGGRLHLPTARGHFSLDPPLQAVDLAVRRAGGIHALEGITLRPGPGFTRATERSGRAWHAVVVSRAAGRHVESCGADPVPGEVFDVDLAPA